MLYCCRFSSPWLNRSKNKGKHISCSFSQAQNRWEGSSLWNKTLDVNSFWLIIFNFMKSSIINKIPNFSCLRSLLLTFHRYPSGWCMFCPLEKASYSSTTRRPSSCQELQHNWRLLSFQSLCNEEDHQNRTSTAIKSTSYSL